MSVSKDPYAEASKLWPHEDPDALWSAAFGATWRWRKTLEPFVDVRWTFIQHEMQRLGRELTEHVDADARERIKARSRARWDAFGAQLQQWITEARDEADATPDIIASGW